MLTFTNFLNETLGVNNDVKKITDLLYRAVISNISTLKSNGVLTFTNFLQNNYPDIVIFNDTLIFKISNNLKLQSGIVEQKEKNNIIIKLEIIFEVNPKFLNKLKKTINHEFTHIIEHLYSKELSIDWYLYRNLKEHQKKYKNFTYWIGLSQLFYDVLANELRSRTSGEYEMLKDLKTKNSQILKSAILNSEEYKKLNDILKIKPNDIINTMKQKYPNDYVEILSDFMLKFYEKEYSEKNFNSIIDNIKHKVRKQVRKLLRLVSTILNEDFGYIEIYEEHDISYCEYIQKHLQ